MTSLQWELINVSIKGLSIVFLRDCTHLPELGVGMEMKF